MSELTNAIKRDKDNISLKTKWVRTDAWRGYEEPIYAFAGYNDTGNWSDSPYPTSSGQSSRKKFTAYLRKNKIPFKHTTKKTSNVFSVNHYFVTSSKNVSRAKTLTRQYITETGDDNIWVA